MNHSSNEFVWEKIDQLNLSPIVAKLMHSKGWGRDYCSEIEKWYKRFLFLSYKYNGQPIVVNEIIDEFWHTHILDTKKYIDDCQNIFGYYLHHFPYFGMRGEEDRTNLQRAFETTNSLFLKEFGETKMRTKGCTGISTEFSEEDFFQAAGCSDCAGFYENETVALNNFDYSRPSM